MFKLRQQGVSMSGPDKTVLEPSDIPSATDSSLVCVSKSGNDVTGTGSSFQPFLTIGAAMASILDATVAKRYVILLEPGIYTENVLLKPNVFITGVQGNVCRINGTVDLDPSWAGPANNRSGLDNCVVIGPATFDLIAVGAPNGFILGQFSFFNGDVILTSNSAGNLISLECPSFNANLTINGGLVFLQDWDMLNVTALSINAVAAQVDPTFVVLGMGSANGLLRVTADPTSGGAQITVLANLSEGTALLDGVGVQVFAAEAILPLNVGLANGALAPVNAEATLIFGFGSPIAINPGMNTFALDMTSRGVVDDGWAMTATLIDDNNELVTCVDSTSWASGVGTLKVFNPGAGFNTANSFDVSVLARKVQ